MKIKYLNSKHQKIVESYVRSVKEVIYYATEESEEGKYNEFTELISTIVTYSNNFHKGVSKNDGAKEEFAFMIPNLLFYMAIGFLQGIQKKDQEYNTMKVVQKLANEAQEITGKIADILIDEDHEERRREILSEDIKTTNN
jgi:hypothetical protein|tara:strand:+ start:145 stop:567 length:423 start_codon:yes stop_codon:yes gene_type:complete